jgi:hypothetical protein
MAQKGVTMATAEECRKALESLTARLAEMDASAKAAKLADRTLSLHVPDLGVTYLTRLGPNGADPIVETHDRRASAQIRFTARSDDVLAVASEPGAFARLWLTGKIKVQGSVLDLISLRKLL